MCYFNVIYLGTLILITEWLLDLKESRKLKKVERIIKVNFNFYSWIQNQILLYPLSYSTIPECYTHWGIALSHSALPLSYPTIP